MKLSTPVALLALAALVTLDLVGVGHIAGAVDSLEAAEPAQLPGEAFLTQRDVPSTTVQSVLARIEETPEAFLLRLTNAGEETRSIDLEAVCYQRIGSPMSRMGVQRMEVAADRVVATIAAGQTLVQKLGCAPAQRKEAEGEQELAGFGLLEGSFSTTDFEIFAGESRHEAAARPRMTATGKRLQKRVRRPAPIEPLARLRVSRELGEKVAAKAVAPATEQG